LRAGTLSTAIARMFLFNIQVDSSHSETPAPKACSKLAPPFFLKDLPINEWLVKMPSSLGAKRYLYSNIVFLLLIDRLSL